MTTLVVYTAKYRTVYRAIGSQDDLPAVTGGAWALDAFGSSSWFGHGGAYYRICIEFSLSHSPQYRIVIHQLRTLTSVSDRNTYDTCMPKFSNSYVNTYVSMIPCGNVWIGVIDVLERLDDDRAALPPALRYVVKFDRGSVAVEPLMGAKITQQIPSHSTYTAWDPVYSRLHHMYWNTSTETMIDCISGASIADIRHNPVFVGVYNATITIVTRRYSVRHDIVTGEHTCSDESDDVVTNMMKSIGDHMVLMAKNVFNHNTMRDDTRVTLRDLRTGDEYDMIPGGDIQSVRHFVVCT